MRGSLICASWLFMIQTLSGNVFNCNWTRLHLWVYVVFGVCVCECVWVCICVMCLCAWVHVTGREMKCEMKSPGLSWTRARNKTERLPLSYLGATAVPFSLHLQRVRISLQLDKYKIKHICNRPPRCSVRQNQQAKERDNQKMETSVHVSLTQDAASETPCISGFCSGLNSSFQPHISCSSTLL